LRETKEFDLKERKTYKTNILSISQELIFMGSMISALDKSRKTDKTTAETFV